MAKLRRIGHGFGTTFRQEILDKAGLVGGEELEILAMPGEIRLRRTDGRIHVELTPAEAAALIKGETETRAAKRAIAKVSKAVEDQ